MKIALGVLAGIGLFFILIIGGCVALVGGTVSSMDEAAKEREDAVSFTATDAGTTTDYAGDVYTVIELSFQNDSEDETVMVHTWDFSAELEDGSVSQATDYSGDLEDPLETVDIGPGQTTSGQIAVSGDVDVAKIQWENDIFSDEKKTAEVK